MKLEQMSFIFTESSLPASALEATGLTGVGTALSNADKRLV